VWIAAIGTGHQREDVGREKRSFFSKDKKHGRGSSIALRDTVQLSASTFSTCCSAAFSSYTLCSARMAAPLGVLRLRVVGEDWSRSRSRSMSMSMSMSHHFLEEAGFKTPEPEGHQYEYEYEYEYDYDYDYDYEHEHEHEHGDVLMLFTTTTAREAAAGVAAAKPGPARVCSFGPGAPPAPPQHQPPMETDDHDHDRVFNRPPLHTLPLVANAATRSPLDTVLFALPTQGTPPPARCCAVLCCAGRLG
jgi:hypothetical protein